MLLARREMRMVFAGLAWPDSSILYGGPSIPPARRYQDRAQTAPLPATFSELWCLDCSDVVAFLPSS